MKILVIGSGGRESALIWKILQSEKKPQVFVAPGNAGNEKTAKRINIQATDIEKLAIFAQDNEIDLTVVGPEAPLVKGIVDEFEKKGLKIFGPSKQASLLEGSKAFTKKILIENNIPTAEGEIFDDFDKALDYINKKNKPLVVKADGLAAGKGVIVADTKEEAILGLKRIMKNMEFGDAGKKVVIEEKLSGFETSILAFCNGKEFTMLVPSQDHKPIFEGNKGPNTGGMGAYSPVPSFTDENLKQAEEIIKNTLLALEKNGINYRGILYAGLMVTNEGAKVLEFNVRFGDPETQAVLPRMKSDIIPYFENIAEKKSISELTINWDNRTCVCVVAASKGYPGKYNKGYPITGIEDAEKEQDTFVFTAGCEKKDGQIVTSGGRVLSVSSLGKDIEEARQKAYNALLLIKFTDMYYRKDIGFAY